MTRSTPVRMLAVLALLSGGLAVAVQPPNATADVASDTAYPFEDETFTLSDTKPYPASLVTMGGEGRFQSSTLLGTISQEYGLASGDLSKVTDQQRQTWSDDEPYVPMAAGRSRLLGADDVAVGDLDGDATATDPAVDAAYLVRGPAGGDDELVVMGSQGEGFAPLTSRSISSGALSVAMTEKTSMTPALLYVRYADRLSAYRYDAAAAGGELVQMDVRLPRTLYLDLAGVRFTDAYHRASWLDAGEQLSHTADERATSLALAFVATNGNMSSSLLTVTSGTATSVTLTPVDSGYPGSLGARGPWTSAQVRYDWLPPTAAVFGQGPQVGHVLATTGRTAAGTNHVSVDLARDPGPPAGRFVSFDVGTGCGDDEALDIDIEQYDLNTLVGCASIDHTAGGADRVVQSALRLVEDATGSPATFAGTSTWATAQTDAVSDAVALTQPQTRVVLPCVWLHRTDPTKTCSSNTSLGDIEAGNVALLTTVAGGPSSGVATSQYQTSAAFLDVVENPLLPQGLFWWSELDVAAPVTAAAPMLVAPLPTEANRVTVSIPNDPVGNPPVLATTDPIPVAFLAAPPEVAGAGQQGDAPEFASAASSTSGSTTSTSTTYGATAGVEYEDVTGAFGASLEVALDQEVADERTIERTVSTTQAYRGLTDADTVVYRSVPLVRWSGTVTGSTTGVGIGTAMAIDLPRSGMITTATSVANLAQRYPDLYGPDGQLAPVLARAFPHTVGDPGSYLPDTPSSSAIDDTCDGSTGPGGPRELPSVDDLLAPNPFFEAPPAPPQPDVLTSDLHQVVTGTGNAEGASFSIEDAATTSRVQTQSVTVSASVKAGYFNLGASYGNSIGKGWSSTLAGGVDFASFVGHIPSDNPALSTETYQWRSFLCQATTRDALGIPVTAWLYSYTTKNYEGSGGMAPLAPLVGAGPSESQVTDPAATVLRWTQETGTVEDYDWKVEAIGTRDVRTGQLSYATPKMAKATDPHAHAVPLPQTLLPGQLYRWKVDATDFFGNVVSSDWDYFVTSGAAGTAGAGTTGGPAAGPTAVTDRVGGVEDTALAINATANDLNPAGGALTLSVASPPLLGTVDAVGGALRYVPRRDACGLDAFDYTITDSAGRTSTATDIVKVECVNDTPIAVNDRVRMARGETTLRLIAPGPLGNDVDAEGGPFTARLTGKPKGARVKLGAAGALVVRMPARSRKRSVQVHYKACDMQGACSAAGVVTVQLR